MSRTRRGSRTVVLLVTLLLLAGLLVLVDRGAQVLGERAVASRVTQAVQGVESGPEVSFAGFPFLTQLVTGFDHISLGGSGVEVDGTRYERVEVDLFDVSSGSPRRADRVEGTAVLLPGDVLPSIGENVEYRIEDDGVLVVADVFGQELSVRAVPQVNDSVVTFDLEEVNLGGVTVSTGDLPAPVTDALTGIEVELRQLPEQIRIDEVEVRDTGGDGEIVVFASGVDVPLEQQ